MSHLEASITCEREDRSTRDRTTAFDCVRPVRTGTQLNSTSYLPQYKGIGAVLIRSRVRVRVHVSRLLYRTEKKSA